MAMLNVRLNDEDERKLGQVLSVLKASSKSELVKRLINDQWVALQAGRTFVERRGGHPKYLLSEPSAGSERKQRKKVLGEYYEGKARLRRGRS